MKRYLAVFTGSPSGPNGAKWNALDEKTRKEREKKGMLAWMNWAEQTSKSIVEMGGPLGKTKQVDPKGITDIRNNLSACTIVQAESHEAAAKLFLNHPHFMIFPGDSIEIMEIMPIPSM